MGPRFEHLPTPVIIIVNLLCLECVKSCLSPVFSDVSAATLREAEEKTYLFFADFLQECEGNLPFVYSYL